MGYLKLTNGSHVIEMTGEDIHIPPGNWTVTDAHGDFTQIRICQSSTLEFSGRSSPFVKYEPSRTVLSFDKGSVIPSWWGRKRKNNRKDG